MREVRIFEMEHREPVAAWRVARPSTFKVISGEVWLTIEGRRDDHWLSTGESVELPRRAVAWISAGEAGARFSLASGSERAVPAPASRFGLPVLSRLPRWLGVV